MAHVLLVDFKTSPAHAEDFAAAIFKNAQSSVDDEPGCHQFDVCRDPQDATVFFLYEIYDDEAAIAAHIATPHFKRFDEATRPWVVSKAVRKFVRAHPQGV
jgi:autoinducer 2-degrading protein